MGSIVISNDVLSYILFAIKASFLQFNICNTYKNNISKMFFFCLNLKLLI